MSRFPCKERFLAGLGPCTDWCLFPDYRGIDLVLGRGRSFPDPATVCTDTDLGLLGWGSCLGLGTGYTDTDP